MLRFARYVRGMGGYRLQGIGSRIDPSDLLQDGGDVPPGGEDCFFVHEVSQEEIAVAVGAPAERVGVVLYIVRFDKGIHRFWFLRLRFQFHPQTPISQN